MLRGLAVFVASLGMCMNPRSKSIQDHRIARISPRRIPVFIAIRTMGRRCVLDHFAGKSFREITPMLIEKFKRARLKAPTRSDRQRRVASVNRELACISKIFSLAMRDKMTDSNPCRQVRKYEEHNERNRYLSLEEEERLLSASDGQGDQRSRAREGPLIQIRNRPKSNMAYAYSTVSRKTERIEIFNGELGFVKPHGFDGGKWKWNTSFWLKRFQVVFSRKKEQWVNYGSELGRAENDRWIPRQPVEENLELAYAISVHKAQGSEFERTYVIVPKTKVALLSPELFYTALTRATRHCTLLVEQDISALIDLRRREKSHLIQINSSLFEFRPAPMPLVDLGPWHEEGKIHQALIGCMVRSKSEVIIANLLTAAGIPFEYEIPLFASDGTLYLPDFTITWRGKPYYWEHLGKLNDAGYVKKWEKKTKWYSKHFRDSLLVTEESAKLSKSAERIILETFK